MKIAVVFFGITRSLSFTISSIEKNVIFPAKSKADAQLLGHFFNQSLIDNPRSEEKGELDSSEYALLKLDWVHLEEPGACLEQWDFPLIAASGDAWNDGLKSLKNLVHQLHSLRIATRKALSLGSDIVIFCRPDLLYHDDFSRVIDKAMSAKNGRVYVPFWQWHGGLNDRFAICVGKQAIHAYGCRIECIKEYLVESSQPLHSEIFLRQVLRKKKIQVIPMLLRASRVRLGGAIKNESFSFIRNMAWKKIIGSKFCGQ